MVLLFFVLFLVVGALGFRQLNIEAYPDPVPPTVVVITQNPGQSAAEVERNITIPIEVAMSGLPNLTTVRSTSLFGLSDVRIQFNFNYTYEEAVQQVLNRLGQMSGLPAGAQPGISPASPIGEIMRYRLVGPPGYPLEDLKTLQEWVLDRRFKRVPGVIDVTSFGGTTKTYSVQVDLGRLAAYGLSLSTVVDAIRNGSVNVGAGLLSLGPQSVVVQGIGLIRNVDEIGQVVIGSQGGQPVLVSDVATVQLGTLPRLGVAGHAEDDDVVLGTVLMRRGEQTLPTIHLVQQEVARINAGGVLPPGVSILTLYDREDLVASTTVKVVHNILEGVLLILVIQWLFLGDLRGAAVIAATIPFAFFFAVLMMLARGESANLLSLGALDFGLLVDATVIMVENIFRHLHLARHTGTGQPRPVPMTVLKAAAEVDKAILFSILIIIAAFIPLFAMGGIEGRIFGPMAKTYAYAIGGALLATFTITPALAATFFKADTEERDTFAVKGIRWAYTRLFGFGLRRRVATLALAAVMLVGSAGVMTRLGAEFLPTLEEGSIWLRATMPSTISLEEGNPVANRIRHILQEFPEVITVTSQQGRPDDGTDSAGFFNAEFFVPLLPQERWTTAPNRDGLVSAVSRRLAAEFPGVEFSFSQTISDNVQEAASGVKGANAVKVIGPDIAIASRIADRIRREMAQVQGIADLGVLLSVGQQTLSITVDRARAARLGLTVGDVNNALSAAVGGQEAGAVFEAGGDRQFPIIVRLAEAYRGSIDAIGRVPVGGAGNAVLRDVARIEMISGPSYIYRENSARYVPVRFSVRERDPASAVQEAQERVGRNVELPQGYRLEWVGEFRNLQLAVARLMVVVPIALAIIAVLLYISFGRLRETLMVFSMLPLSISGGVFALALADLHFSVPAAIGFLALLGITVMEAIIFLSYFRQLQEQEGMEWTPALLRAGFDRLRPVMMTCFASFCGLLPMALATGVGADVTKPLAVVVVGGIGLVPIFILVVLPAAVDLLGRGPAEREYLLRNPVPAE
ncbi:MAG: cytochrome peroxidase [Rhodospirillales bacterium]|nr:cytochrome peroxidase [Rhodospirillales bacterium]